MADSPSGDPITFHARVGTGGRIVIPESERAASGIEVGDLVQVTVLRAERKLPSPGGPA